MGGNAKKCLSKERAEENTLWDCHDGEAWSRDSAEGRGQCVQGWQETLQLHSPAQPELSTPLSTLITGTSRINSSTYFPVLFAATEG